jgi:acyl-CoA synthetase (AMP-forming)/AMP-acid ligase II
VEGALPALDGVKESIQRAVAGRHDLRVEAVLLLPPATLPRTTSGKVRRHLCRAGYLAGAWNALIKN